jgi:hypothetical protein
MMTVPQMVVTHYKQTQIILMETISELSGSTGSMRTTAKEFPFYKFFLTTVFLVFSL